jgi:uncharacterized protein (TIGR02145 family)
MQTVTTSALGLITVKLGSSMPLTGVDWSFGSKFIQVEIDMGQGFLDMGTQQLLSVPYSLNASSVSLNVSLTGDTLFVGSSDYVIIPGISDANNYTTSSTMHVCGAANIHNANLTYGSMTDQEGNVYKTIVIGTQEWMAENLNTSIYRNGDPILTNLDNATWQTTTSGAWAYYNDDPSYACPFGKLYNWFACSDPRGLCPTGWHVPSDPDWNSLIYFLDPTVDSMYYSFTAGGKMKSTGTIESQDGFWHAPNAGADNSCGFSALPNAMRIASGQYYQYGYGCHMWCITEFDNVNASSRAIPNGGGSILGGNGNGYANKQQGFSVRCVKD